MTNLGRITVTRSDIARLTGVQRPAVTNWERRHSDFPQPVPSLDRPGVDVFRANEIAAWLDRRTIAVSGRRDGELPGTTFGHRFRQALGDNRFSSPEFVRGLLSQQDRFRGEVVSDEYLKLLLAMVFVWGSDHDARSSAMSLVGAAQHVFDFNQRITGHEGSTALAEVFFRQGPTSRVECAEVFDLLVDHYRSAHGRRDGGEFFTPRSVARTMALLLAATGPPPAHVHDPFCRAGEVLTAMLATLPAEATPHVTGTSPGSDALALARMNLALHETERAELAYGMEVEATAPQPGWQNGADWIATNPPFGFKLSTAAGEQHWHYGPPGSRGDFAWLQHVVSRLAPGGRAAVVMPNGAAFVGGRARKIRTAMVEDGVVECIVALPSQLFTNTSIPVSVWILTRPKVRRPDVLFIDGSALGVMTGPASRELSETDISVLVDAYIAWRGGEVTGKRCSGGTVSVPSRALGLAEIRDRGYRLTPQTAVVPDTPLIAADATRQPVALRMERLRSAADRLKALEAELEWSGGQRTGDLVIPTREPGTDLPPGWSEAPFGDLAKISIGPGGPWQGRKDQGGEGPRVARARNISGHRLLHQDTEVLSPQAAEAYAKYRLQAGDLVMTRSGTVGRCALVTDAENGWLFGTHLMRIRPLTPSWSTYLLGFLTSPAAQSWIDRWATGTAVRSLSANDLAKLPVPLPPEAEREKIGHTLYLLDERLRSHSAIVMALDAYREELLSLLMSGHMRME
ncbi:N-6 DNA methylase [Streptomyces sp. LE64]|uniref:N-6 DNA methylase n=1 Tax=Streptomyces sp. LE64 TaxID=3448653 RepID=UPI0040430C23